MSGTKLDISLANEDDIIATINYKTMAIASQELKRALTACERNLSGMLSSGVTGQAMEDQLRRRAKLTEAQNELAEFEKTVRHLETSGT